MVDEQLGQCQVFRKPNSGLTKQFVWGRGWIPSHILTALLSLAIGRTCTVCIVCRVVLRLYHQADTILVLEPLLVTRVPLVFHGEVSHGKWAYGKRHCAVGTSAKKEDITRGNACTHSDIHKTSDKVKCAEAGIIVTVHGEYDSFINILRGLAYISIIVLKWHLKVICYLQNASFWAIHSWRNELALKHNFKHMQKHNLSNP